MIINFDGKKLNDYFYISDLQGLGMPTTKDRELEMMNIDGNYFDGTNLDARVVTITASMIPTATKTIYQLQDEIKGIFAPWKGEKQLDFDAYPDRYLMGRYSGTQDITQIGMYQSFPVSFRCSDPLFYEKAEQNLTIAANLTANNKGTWPTKAITLETTIGAGVTLTITNTTTGKNLVLQNTTGSAQAVSIDFKTATITNPAKTTNWQTFFVSGDFFTLQPGNNALTFSGYSGTSSFKFRSTWV